MREFTRREFIGAAAALSAVAIAGCGSGHEAAPTGASTGAPGAWSFTDDRGVTVSLNARPKRFVAYDLAASALMNIGLKPVGIFGSWPLDVNPQFAGLDLSGIATVGDVYGQLNLELLARLRPEVIVTIYDPRLTGPVIGFANSSVQGDAQKLAPIIAINSITGITTICDRFEHLGAAMGADLSAPLVADAHRRFETASGQVRSATGAKPGLTALAFAALQGIGFAFARPDQSPELLLFEQLGLHMVKPTSAPADINKNYNGFFYEYDSDELAGKYTADLLLHDDLPGALTVSALKKIPTWRTLPAVKAGQVLGWRVLGPFSYRLLGEDLAALATAVEHAKILT